MKNKRFVIKYIRKSNEEQRIQDIIRKPLQYMHTREKWKEYEREKRIRSTLSRSVRTKTRYTK